MTSRVSKSKCEAVVETGGSTGGAQAATLSIGALLAAADAAKGVKEASACAACHNFAKGAPNKSGPNLWDVVERAKASYAPFAYSAGLIAQADQKWTYDNLNAFITNPKAHVPGTKMGYGGLKNDGKRANLIAYLASLSDAPKPYPAP